jgi:hypothetical protein
MTKITIKQRFFIKMSNKMEKNYPKKEVKSAGMLILFFSVSVLFSFFLIQSHSFRLVILWWFIAGGVLWIVSSLLGRFYSNKFTRFLQAVAGFWIGILYAPVVFIIPFTAMVFHVLFYFGFAFLLPHLALTGISYFDLVPAIENSTEYYLLLTSGVFISVLANTFILRLVLYISPARVYTSEKLKPFGLESLSRVLLSAENIRSFVYGLYFILLVIINCYTFQGRLPAGNVNTVILQSFVTYIAFDRALGHFKGLKFSFSNFRTQIFQSIENKVKEDHS